jgi:hypothetical protein
MSHSLEAVIRAYQQRNLAKAERELRSFAEEPTLESAVARAALAQRFNGKRWVRYDHQRRIPRHALEAAREALLAAPLASLTVSSSGLMV